MEDHKTTIGEFRWMAGGYPPLEMKMTGPSGSEPEDKRFVWFEIPLVWVHKHINIFSECGNCQYCIDFMSDASLQDGYGINGFCYNCQKHGFSHYNKYKKIDDILQQEQEEPPDLGWDTPGWDTPEEGEIVEFYHYRRNENDLARRIPNLEETKTCD